MESGQIIAGKYRLNQLLGSGGMATVWSATNLFTEREFAIKFLNPGAAKNTETATRFLNEAKVSARINHPNIIDILDVGQTETGNLFLVMELLTGVPLEVALRRQQPPMSLHEFTFVMVEVARALAAAHRNGVVHRDLKPSNVFLHKDKSGAAQPKLLDFGVSKFLTGERDHALTVAGTVLGSPLYMSPEQARGDDDIDGRTDVFAFGVIMFEALTGLRPFDGQNFNQLIVNIATKPPKSIDFHAPHMPHSLRAIVHTCLEPDKSRRTVPFDVIAERLYDLLPELEASPFRLPAQQSMLSTHDPDATHALPVVRPSDRPPPQDPGLAQGGTPSPSYASISLTQQHKLSPRSVILAGAAVTVVIVGALLGVVLSIALRARRAEAVSPERTEAPVETPPSSAAAPSHDPPVVDFDSLPMQKPGTAGKPMGRLVITAAPGWCTVSVDGVAKGPTPLPTLDLAAGPHQLKCEPPDRKAKIKLSSVTIAEGQTARIAFQLDP